MRVTSLVQSLVRDQPQAAVLLRPAGPQQGSCPKAAGLKPLSVSIKVLSHKARRPGAGDWEQSPTSAPLIDSVKKLMNVGCYVAGGRDAS